MSAMGLVLSLFPGIGLLDRAFEEEGFCVVRGPDLLWGGDVRAFHPPAGVFAGVIGGPPCKRWSALANIVRAVHGEASVAPDLIPEFERVVNECDPDWFVMENVPKAPRPITLGHVVRDVMLNNRMFGGEQNRERRFSFGSRNGRALSASAIMASVRAIRSTWEPAVCSTAGGRRASVALGGSGKPKGNQGRGDDARLRNRTFVQECELQGLPADFLSDAPFTLQGKREAVGNGVPLPMGRAVARAVKAAMYPNASEGAA
jgi:DNA (cytosine-5)-methyltransferase 1